MSMISDFRHVLFHHFERLETIMTMLENTALETLQARCCQLRSLRLWVILRIPSTVLGCSGHQQSCGAVRPEFSLLPNEVFRIANHFELLVRGRAEDLSCFDVF